MLLYSVRQANMFQHDTVPPLGEERNETKERTLATIRATG